MNYKVSRIVRLVWTYIFLDHNTLLPLTVAAGNTAETEIRKQPLNRYIVQCIFACEQNTKNPYIL